LVVDAVNKDRLVGIVDDEQDITELFRDALSTINGITILHSQIQYWLLNTLRSITKSTCW